MSTGAKNAWVAGAGSRYRWKADDSEAGFTLIELLVAVTILSIGILGIAQVFIVSNNHTMSGDKELAAASLAQEMREKILSETYTDVLSIFDNVDTNDPGSLTTPCQMWATHIANQLGESGRGQIDVIPDTEDPEVLPRMLGVSITLSWLETDEPKDMNLRFVITRMG